MCIPLPIDSPSLPPLPQKYAQNGAEAEVCRGRRTFNTGSRYEPVLKGGGLRPAAAPRAPPFNTGSYKNRC